MGRTPVCPPVDADNKKRVPVLKPRSRRSVKSLIKAFDNLRSFIPTYPPGKKLTKIETLRLAMLYIQDLSNLLQDSANGDVDVSADTMLRARMLARPLASSGRTQSCADLGGRRVMVSPMPSEALSDEPPRTRFAHGRSPGHSTEDFAMLDDLVSFFFFRARTSVCSPFSFH